jgi:hypothetical protein
LVWAGAIALIVLCLSLRRRVTAPIVHFHASDAVTPRKSRTFIDLPLYPA